MTELTSWNDGATKQAILEFVDRVTTLHSPDFVPVADRIAVFDNDGTLWCEKPLPIQADFLVRRIGAMAHADPSLRARQPWKAVVEHDVTWLAEVITKHYRGDDLDLHLMEKGLLAAYARTSIEQYQAIVADFFRTARHSRLDRLYVDCTYRPMVDLLRFLGEHDFTVYIASGGGRDFMRVVSEQLYGIPPERVIGSSAKLSFDDRAAFATLLHESSIDIFDDGPAKPVQIWGHSGRRPIFGGGNSNGDIAMLRFCAHPSRPSFCLLVDHDDAEREFAYREGAEDALERAARDRWTIASITSDWQSVFYRSDSTRNLSTMLRQ